MVISQPSNLGENDLFPCPEALGDGIECLFRRCVHWGNHVAVITDTDMCNDSHEEA